MTNYDPDKWVLVEFTTTEGEKLMKVFGGWYGGYLGSDSWRINSGIVKTVRDGDYIHFHGTTGSVYTCHKNAYGMTGLMVDIYGQFPASISSRILNEEQAREYYDQK